MLVEAVVPDSMAAGNTTSSPAPGGAEGATPPTNQLLAVLKLVLVIELPGALTIKYLFSYKATEYPNFFP